MTRTSDLDNRHENHDCAFLTYAGSQLTDFCQMLQGMHIAFAFLVLFLAGDRFTLNAQIHFQDLPPVTDSSELVQLMAQSRIVLDSLVSAGHQVSRMDILECTGQKYLLPDGMFDVFAWEKGYWKKIYLGKFHGYNFNSKKICWNGNLYSFGGNGFWRQHGELTYFERKTGEWEIVLLEGPNRSGNGLAFGFNSQIYVIQPLVFDQGFVESKKKQPSFRIDLPDSSIGSFRHPRMLLEDYRHLNLHTFETDQFLYVDSRPCYLIRKSKQKIYASGTPLFPELTGVTDHPDWFIYSVGDSLSIWDASGTMLSIMDFNGQALAQLKPLQKTRSQIQKIMVLAGSAVPIFSLLAFVYYRRRRQNGPRQEQLEFRHKNIPDLLKSSGQILSTEELDVVLRIHLTDNPDKLRYRRAALINEINLEMKSRTGKQLIVRAPDPEDKRRFLYHIN